MVAGLTLFDDFDGLWDGFNGGRGGRGNGAIVFCLWLECI